MRNWIPSWRPYGFLNANRKEVANRDLFEQASGLDDQVLQRGIVDYVWIPREQNAMADIMCNRCLNAQEQKEEQEHRDQQTELQ